VHPPPRGSRVRAVARCLRARGRLVTVTHEWAIAKHQALDEWEAVVAADLVTVGCEPPACDRDDYRSGRGLALRTTKR